MIKKVREKNYNYNFNTENGVFARWGKTLKTNPDYSPLGPEILDIEISTICSKGCLHCYKSNTSYGQNMSFLTFKNIFDKMSKNLLQVAFGIGDLSANKDLWDMMMCCRDNNVVPNITINGQNLTQIEIDTLTYLCGAVSVSNYTPSTVCYDTVEALSKRGLKQVNIHMLVAKETIGKCYKLIEDTKKDKRLKNLNSIVFLLLKPKGLRNHLTLPSKEEYFSVIKKALSYDINLGFDSCSAKITLDYFKKNQPDKVQYIEQFIEPCESTCFSAYCNVKGEFFPCSFAEKEVKGINIENSNNFINDVWNNGNTIEFRNKLLAKKRSCPVFNLELE